MAKRLSRRKTMRRENTLKTIKKYTGGWLSLTKNKNRWKSKYELMKRAWEREVRSALSSQFKYSLALVWLKNNTLRADRTSVVGQPYWDFDDFLKHQARSEKAYIDNGMVVAGNLPEIVTIINM